MKPLIDEGRVYLAQPPLYKIASKSGKLETVRYAWTDEQLANYLKEFKTSSCSVTKVWAR